MIIFPIICTNINFNVKYLEENSIGVYRASIAGYATDGSLLNVKHFWTEKQFLNRYNTVLRHVCRRTYV